MAIPTIAKTGLLHLAMMLYDLTTKKSLEARLSPTLALSHACGVPHARNIGRILQQNTDPDTIPCYKVVRSDGRLTNGYKFGGQAEQKRRLEAEGIVFDARGRIRQEFFFRPID